SSCSRVRAAAAVRGARAPCLVRKKSKNPMNVPFLKKLSRLRKRWHRGPGGLPGGSRTLHHEDVSFRDRKPLHTSARGRSGPCGETQSWGFALLEGSGMMGDSAAGEEGWAAGAAHTASGSPFPVMKPR